MITDVSYRWFLLVEIEFQSLSQLFDLKGKDHLTIGDFHQRTSIILFRGTLGSCLLSIWYKSVIFMKKVLIVAFEFNTVGILFCIVTLISLCFFFFYIFFIFGNGLFVSYLFMFFFSYLIMFSFFFILTNLISQTKKKMYSYQECQSPLWSCACHLECRWSEVWTPAASKMLKIHLQYNVHWLYIQNVPSLIVPYIGIDIYLCMLLSTYW